jgi:hypothetical protein
LVIEVEEVADLAEGVGVGVGGIVAVAVAVIVAVGVGDGVTQDPVPQAPLTLNTRCMFGKPMDARSVGVVIAQLAALI